MNAHLYAHFNLSLNVQLNNHMKVHINVYMNVHINSDMKIYMVKKYQGWNPYWANVTKTFAL